MKTWLFTFLIGCGAKTLVDEGGVPVDVSDTAGEVDADTDADSDADADADTDTDTDTDADTDVDADLRYDQVVFKATHNSYVGGDVGALTEQLDAGVRLVELDFHDNDYISYGFRVGHLAPGNGVDLDSPNPSTPQLQAWLDMLRAWSDAHPAHTPVTLMLDIKDDLTDNRSFEAGNLASLNQQLDEALGDKLYRRSGWDEWPELSALEGQFIVVLSGASQGASRKAYVRDRGREAAVAMNDLGQVVEVHRSHSSDELWYWTGQLQADGTVEWLHHGRYDSGVQPAVAINNAGQVVEVHKSQSLDRLWYWTAELGDDGDLIWHENQDYDDGVHPSIAFQDLDGSALREIHTSQTHADENWDWELSLVGTDLDWGDHGRTDDAVYSIDVADSSAGMVRVLSAEDGAGDSNTLLYSTGAVSVGRIRYPQLAFIDVFSGEDEILAEASPFRSFGHGSADDAAEWRDGGGISRVWSFQVSDIEADLSPPSFPATDTPFERWYTDWCETLEIADD